MDILSASVPDDSVTFSVCFNVNFERYYFFFFCFFFFELFVFGYLAYLRILSQAINCTQLYKDFIVDAMGWSLVEGNPSLSEGWEPPLYPSAKSTVR